MHIIEKGYLLYQIIHKYETRKVYWRKGDSHASGFSYLKEEDEVSDSGAELYFSIGMLIVFLIAYLYVRQTNTGRTRLLECYLVMAVGLSVELIFVGYHTLIYTHYDIGGIIPGALRLHYFIGFLFFIFIGYVTLWLDIILQYLKIRKEEA